MKNNLPLIIVLLLFYFATVTAQDFKLGKVSVAELEQKFHPKDSSAVAAILFKKGDVQFDYSPETGFEIITTVKTRIKVYKKEGYHFANFNVPYYLYKGSDANVKIENAVTYNLVDGKMEKTKLGIDGIFVEKINQNFAQKKITMPNIKEGCVIEYEYSTKSNNIGSLMEWRFQYEVPVNYSEFATAIPEYFDFRISQKGFFPIAILNNREGRSINYTDPNRVQTGNSVSYQNQNLSFTEAKATYSAKDLPAIKEEPFVNNMENYIAGIDHELSSISYPQTKIKYYSTNWEAVVKTIYEYDSFGAELNKSGYFEEDVKALLVNLKTPSEIITGLLNHVKNTVKWNNNAGYGCNEGVKAAYKNKTGNCAEINLMLTAMLRFAGLTANPVLISTRANGIPVFPSRNAFNFVLAAVETPEGLVLLDATEKYSEPNILPLRDLNWLGRLIRKDATSIEVDLTPKTSALEVKSMMVTLKPDGAIEGQARFQHSNHAALEFRKKFLAQDPTIYLENLENRNGAIEISDYSRDNDKNLSEPIIEKFKFKQNKNVDFIAGKMYIKPMFFLNSGNNPFKQEDRLYPVDFGFPKQERYNISISIPAGFVVESVPASLNIAVNKIGTFKFLITKTETNIQVAITKDVTTAIVSPDYYADLKGFLQQIMDKQNEKIVLTKIQ
ncbi:transglutaminase domain-containing protein [Flavobacterium sp.]|uniref:transglutaminase domain-containing protein n=1 Tax=Flavobacterium sp. TaxID=239 RepID=UPI00286DEF6B|nr:transglutaminase domain-containing protein [Flavobacterium sp.]